MDYVLFFEIKITSISLCDLSTLIQINHLGGVPDHEQGEGPAGVLGGGAGPAHVEVTPDRVLFEGGVWGVWGVWG